MGKISHPLISIDNGIFFSPAKKFRQKEKFKIINFAKKKEVIFKVFSHQKLRGEKKKKKRKKIDRFLGKPI